MNMIFGSNLQHNRAEIFRCAMQETSLLEANVKLNCPRNSSFAKLHIHTKHAKTLFELAAMIDGSFPSFQTFNSLSLFLTTKHSLPFPSVFEAGKTGY